MNRVYFILILSLLAINSCSENPTAIKPIETVIPQGNWEIVKEFSVNGPFCIFILPSDTINFERNIPETNSFSLNYESGAETFSDYFECKIINDTIFGHGDYRAYEYTDNGQFAEITYPQTIEIVYLKQSMIHFIIKHGVPEYDGSGFSFGMVTNVYAKKTD